MKKFNLKMAATVMICGSFLFSSCIGSFGLHSKLVSWNQGIGTKFVNELVYLAFNIVPVYGTHLQQRVEYLECCCRWCQHRIAANEQ